jgi:hypothetical protein
MTQPEAPQLAGSEQVARLLETAAASTRKRSHLLLHADQQDQVQRLLIGLEPASYVRPHVHGEQWEMIVLLRGRFGFPDLRSAGEGPAAPGDERGFPGRADPARHLAQRRGGRAANPGPGGKARPLSTERIRLMGSGGRRTREQRVRALGRRREPGKQMALPKPVIGARCRLDASDIRILQRCGAPANRRPGAAIRQE